MSVVKDNTKIQELLGSDTFKTRVINGAEQYDIDKISYSIANNPEFNLKNSNNISIMSINDNDAREEVIEEYDIKSNYDSDSDSDSIKKCIDIMYKLSLDNYYVIDYKGIKYVIYLMKEGNGPIRIKHKVDYYISIYFYFVGSNENFEDLSKICHLYYEKHFLQLENDNNNLSIYLKGEYGYDKTNTIKQKSVETLYLPKKDISSLMNDVEKFIENEKLYKHLDINYKRCYLFEGIWGSGKTSTIRTIATKFKYNISIIAFDSSLTDAKFYEGLRDLPKNSILVLEDIDCLFQERKKNDEMKNMITFSSLLNVLDGMLTKHGLITIMTTNYKINLDKALIRPGRVDYILHFDFIRKTEIKAMFMRFIYVEEDIKEQITNKEERNKIFTAFYDEYKKLNIQITASLLQQYLWKYINKPKEVIENIDEIKDLYDQTNLETEKNLYT